MQSALLLDAHFQPLGLIDWQKALNLVLSEKAEVVTESEQVVRSVTRSFKVPKVLRLLKITFKRYKASFTKHAVFLRDHGACAFCGEKLTLKTFTLDHLVPLSRGGTHDFLNVVVACKACNNQKGARTPSEAGLKLRIQPKVPSRMELIEAHIEHSGFHDLLKDIFNTLKSN